MFVSQGLNTPYGDSDQITFLNGVTRGATTAGSAASPGPGFLTGTYASKKQTATVRALFQPTHCVFLPQWDAGLARAVFFGFEIRLRAGQLPPKPAHLGFQLGYRPLHRNAFARRLRQRAITPPRTQFVTVDCGTPSRLAAALRPIEPASLTASTSNSSVYRRFGTARFRLRHRVFRSSESCQQSDVRATGAGSEKPREQAWSDWSRSRQCPPEWHGKRKCHQPCAARTTPISGKNILESSRSGMVSSCDRFPSSK